MAVPSAPVNVWCQSGDNLAYLSWDITRDPDPATSYKIQRSNDGVNFSDLATSTFNYYSDNSPAAAVVVNSTLLVVGQRYTIVSVGSTTAANWTTLGVPSGTSPAAGVIFIAAATGAGTGSGTVQETGNLYYYQVAGVNISGTGAYTATDMNGIALTAIPVSSGQASLGELRLQAQQRADRVGSNFVTLPEWNKYITQSYKELYDLLIAAYGNDYYVKQPYTFTTSGSIDPNYNAQVFPLPPDFYKLLLCEVALNPGDPNSWITLRQYERVQQNLWNFPNVYTFYGITNLRYRLTGTQIQIVPIASSGQTIRIWYAQRPAKLVADTDLIDGISGWEEFIVVRSAMMSLSKEEEGPTMQDLKEEYQVLTQRLESMAQNRNVGEAQRVSDSRTRNLSWSDDGTWGGAGQW